MDDFYRKMPVIVRAYQMTEARMRTPDEWPEWMSDGRVVLKTAPDYIPDVIMVETMEGDMLCGENGWIVEGVKGELYPCDAAIFRMTYEKVDDLDVRGETTNPVSLGKE